jgi:hypothetical protein
VFLSNREKRGSSLCELKSTQELTFAACRKSEKLCFSLENPLGFSS